MKNLLSILLLPFLFFMVVGARLVPVFFSSEEDKIELAFNVNEQKSKEAKDGKEVKEDKKKDENITHYHLGKSLFTGSGKSFSCQGFPLDRDPYLPCQTPPPDCC